ncbi:MAG TPA: PQQ-binding-like beta-propeller repeat protein [Kofleriaceae bacterium]|nr:PQQ-binding-like beta-propeller repeat protein [Kofleriaceae bacterium]
MLRRLALAALLCACDIDAVGSGDEAIASCPSSVNPIANPGFETGTLTGWKRAGKVAVVARHHGGARSARVGSALATFTGTSRLSQTFTVPAGPSTLYLWMWPACADPSGDRQRIELRSAAGPLLASLFSGCSNARAWTLLQQDTTAWAGQSVRLVASVIDDGDQPSYLNIDDAAVESIAPPVVTFATPAEGAVVASRQDLAITVEAALSPCASLVQLDLFEVIDGIEWPMTSSTSSPLSTSAPATYPSGGPRTYLARATDSAGNLSEAVRHIVRSDDTWSLSLGAAASTDPAIAAGQAAWGLGDRMAQVDRFTGVWLVSPPTSLGATVNPPAFAGDRLFATARNGRLYRVDGPAGTVSVDLRRGLGCVPDDTLRAGPTSRGGLVFAPTWHGCGDRSSNQVIALDADTLAEVWRFNQFGEYQVDTFASACAVDPDADRIYCGARSLGPQASVFAIDASTGAPVWSASAGSVETTPALDAGRRVLYVGDTTGTLHALEADTGAPLGSLPLVSCSLGPCALETPVVATGAYARLVLVADAAGVLHAVYDDPSGGLLELWSHDGTPVHAVRGRPALDVDGGTLYIGDTAGRLLQLALATGTHQGTVEVAAGGGPVASPVLVDEDSDGVLDHILVVSDGLTGDGVARKLPLPLL